MGPPQFSPQCTSKAWERFCTGSTPGMECGPKTKRDRDLWIRPGMRAGGVVTNPSRRSQRLASAPPPYKERLTELQADVRLLITAAPEGAPTQNGNNTPNEYERSSRIASLTATCSSERMRMF